MTLVADWYRSLDDGHVVFCANDSAPNLDYRRDVDAASGIPADDATVTRNPRQDVQHAVYAEDGPTENHESSAIEEHPVVAQGRGAFGEALGGDAMRVDGDSARLAAEVRVVAQPWEAATARTSWSWTAPSG